MKYIENRVGNATNHHKKNNFHVPEKITTLIFQKKETFYEQTTVHWNFHYCTLC